MDERSERLKVLEIFYRRGEKIGLDKGLGEQEIVEASGIPKDRVRFICQYLRELRFTSTDPLGHAIEGNRGYTLGGTRITGQGALYFEDEVTRPKRESRENWFRIILVVLGAVLGAGIGFVGQRVSPPPNIVVNYVARDRQQQSNEANQIPGLGQSRKEADGATGAKPH